MNGDTFTAFDDGVEWAFRSLKDYSSYLCSRETASEIIIGVSRGCI